MARHPDAGGSKKKLLKAQEAYECITRDFWKHDTGASIMREKISTKLKYDNASKKNGERTIFVSLRVYRDHKAQNTLKSLFKNAKDPSRVFVSVCWQYKTETMTEVSNVTGER